MGTDAAAGAGGAAPHRRRWRLQTRMIVAVVSLVALILIAIGMATATTLGSIVSQNLDSRLRVAAANIKITPNTSAAEILTLGRQEKGTLLVVQTAGEPSGAYVAGDDTVVELSPTQIRRVVDAVPDTVPDTVNLSGFGDYRIFATTLAGDGSFVVLGMSAAEQTATLTKILTSVTLITTGGLLVLAAVIALVIGRSLRPLRSVAATATRVAGQRLDSGDVAITERVPAAEADASDEIGRVGAALNSLLDHVDTSLAARQRNEERMRAFVADASHELRTPLAAIRGYSELSLRSLAQAGPDPSPAQLGEGLHRSEEGLQRIHAASLRMTTLVEDLLLLARLDEGKELVYGAVDLSRVVVDAITDAQVAGPDHEWVLDAAPEPVVVAGDAARLHQVVANLLTNARVHTPASTRVTATVTTDAGEAVIRVADNGPGIDPAVADELFERFARADTSRTRQTGGTGLGLSIAQAIVTAHGGTLGVESVPGDTVFEVRLPARPAAPQ